MLLRLLPVAGVAALALLLSGCTSSSTTPPAVTSAAATPSASAGASTTLSPMPTPSPSVSRTAAESSYLTFVQQFSPTLAAKDDDDLLALGRQVCAGFAKGEDEAVVARTLESDDRAQGLDATGAAAILGGSIGALCPKYRSALQGNG